MREEARAEAQSFTAGGRAVFLAFAESPPSILLACSTDSGFHAGDLLKSALAAAGGRGGGNAALAQGSAPSKEALDQLVQSLRERLKFRA